MPTYSISAPDGNTYKIEGPAGATQDQVQAEVLKQHPNAGAAKVAKPEVGNMYTQGAEDIVYDANGIPQNTSSYGSAPTGVTKDAQQALTSTVSLPINMATGAAKSPAAVAQLVGKYFGSNAGDIPVDIINQIEKGTQSQMGGFGNVANQAGSMVGQAAPYVMSPMKVGAPTFLESMATKAVPYVDKVIGAIPSFAQNTAKIVGNIGGNAAIGGASGIATPEQTGLSPEEFANAKKQNVGIQTIIGGALPAVGSMVNALRGTKLSPQMENAVAEARKTGYTVPPTQAGGGVFNRLLEGMAGKISTLQEASVRNQEITNKLATKSLGLPEDTILSPELLKTIRDDAGKAYQNLKLSGTVKTSPKFIQALDNIKPYQDAIQAAKDFPEKAANPVIDVIDSLKRPNFDVNSAISKINVLRNDADIAYRNGNTALGKANKDASQVLENTIENHLANTKQTDLLDKFREARQLIAKTYTVEKAMNKTTGTINAKNLADRLQAGKPISGELKDIAEFAQAFPKASQVPEKIGGTIGISPLDYTVAGITGGASLLGGEDKASSTMNSLVALLARPAARKLVLSAPMQNRLVQQQVANPGAIRNAFPSYEEQKQLAKMLLMQSAGKAAQ